MSANTRRFAAEMVGKILFTVGCCLLPSLAAAVIYKEIRSGLALGATMFLCLVAGITIRRTVPLRTRKVNLRDGFFIVFLCWVTASLAGTLPLLFSGTLPNPLDAFFESCSGFTTTGATLIGDVESVPRSILLWRSSTVFLGGCGIIMFTAFLRDFDNDKGQKLTRRESPMLNYQEGGIKNKAPFYYLFSVYFSLTALLLGLLLIRGMSLFDASVHALSLIGTGGFSSYNNGFAHFQDPVLIWIFIAAMIMVGGNINTISIMVKRGWRHTFRSTEQRAYVFVIAAATGLIILDLIVQGDYEGDLPLAARDAAFQVTSAMSTTGQYITDFNHWPTFARMLLFALMLTGACSSSLGGGPKLFRIVVCLKFIRRGVALKLHPNRVSVLTMDRVALSQETATNITNYMFLYFLTLFLGSLLVSVNGFDLVTTFTSTLSCLNNNGLFFGMSGHGMNFSIFDRFPKFIFSLLMIAGRLELFTVFALFSRYYWDSDKA